MRRVVLFLIVGVAVSAQDTLDEQRARAIHLWLHLDQYVRKITGCPTQGEFTVDQCKLNQGQVDYREYAAAREDARKFFNFKD